MRQAHRRQRCTPAWGRAWARALARASVPLSAQAWALVRCRASLARLSTCAARHVRLIARAAALLAEHPAFLNRIDFVSLNLSGQSLTQDGFLDFIISTLDASGIAGEKICFEITETAAVAGIGAIQNAQLQDIQSRARKYFPGLF